MASKIFTDEQGKKWRFEPDQALYQHNPDGSTRGNLYPLPVEHIWEGVSMASKIFTDEQGKKWRSTGITSTNGERGAHWIEPLPVEHIWAGVVWQETGEVRQPFTTDIWWDAVANRVDQRCDPRTMRPIVTAVRLTT